MAKIPMKFMAKIPIRNPDFIIPISMGPRAAGSSPLFATRWKRRPAMHGSPGAKIMAMAIWKSPASMELLNGKNHGNIMGEHPTGPGSLEPSRGSKYCSSTVRLRTGLQWTIQSINGKNSTVNFENVPRITGADYQRAYKKNQNDMEKPRGNPRVFMIKWWVFMDLSILMLICGQVKEWRKVWVGNRSADGWFWSFIIFLSTGYTVPPPIWVKFWNANFRWLRKPKFSWSNGLSCVMLIVTFWETTCFPY